jgi:rhodanese-related sulfurtransferase
LDIVETKAEELKNYDKVILVCRSGARAGNAKLQLESLGVKPRFSIRKKSLFSLSNL